MTQLAWYGKLKSFIPSWVYEREEKSEAIFQGIAKTLHQIELDYKKHLLETTIGKSSIEYLEQHGKERVIERVSGESLGAYRERVRDIKNRSNCPAIKKMVDSLLINGDSKIMEHSEIGNFFFNRTAYFNRGIISTDILYNAFTVIVPNQTPLPVSFFNREHFSNREDFFGSSESSVNLFNQIISIINNNNKAFGIVYRLFEQLK